MSGQCNAWGTSAHRKEPQDVLYCCTQARIYVWAPGARAQGGILKKSRLKYGMRGKKAVHEREI